jgi:DNA polymerase I-like protein with 3'-5' exonuclease and polymerase domains
MQLTHVTGHHQLPAAFESLAGQPVLGVDIETAPTSEYSSDNRAGLDPYKSRPRLVSVATLQQVFIFDMAHLPPCALDPLSSTPWVAHNAVFEWKHLTHHGYALPAKLHDTQLMGRPLYGGVLSLADLSQQAMGVELDKGLQVSDWAGELSEAQLQYAANDALVTVRLAHKLLGDLNQHSRGQLYELYRKTVPVIGQQVLTGLCVDWEQHRQLYDNWVVERDILKTQLLVLLGDINPRSSKQLGEWLAKQLPAAAIKKWPRTATGNLSTSADTLALNAHIPVVQPLLRYKAAEKLIDTYGKGYEKHRHPVTGNLHPDVLIAGTAGGRFACRNPNVQNPPRTDAFRRLFCAEPGRIMVAADFSQIELRVAALLSKDLRMLAAYAAGDDLHRVTAAAVSGVPLDNVTAGQRQAAKAINFGNLYQQRAPGLARYAQRSYGVAMTTAEAGQAQQRFFSAYPQLMDWQRRRILEARVYGLAYTRMNLPRDFRIRRGYLEAEACNHPIQGSAGEILLASLARLPEYLAGLDARLYNHVHDEILLSVAESDRCEAAQALEGAMVAGFLDIFPEGAALVDGLVEVKTGANWAEVK